MSRTAIAFDRLIRKIRSFSRPHGPKMEPEMMQTKKPVHGRPYDTAPADTLENQVASPSEEDIRRRAYDIWEEEGRPESRDRDHWQRARKELQRPVEDERVGTTAGARKMATSPESDD